MLRLKENFPKPFERVALLLECGCPYPGDHFEGDSRVIFTALESSVILLSDVKYLKNLIFRPKESGAVVFSWLLRASKGTAASLERGRRGRGGQLTSATELQAVPSSFGPLPLGALGAESNVFSLTSENGRTCSDC